MDAADSVSSFADGLPWAGVWNHCFFADNKVSGSVSFSDVWGTAVDVCDAGSISALDGNGQDGIADGAESHVGNCRAVSLCFFGWDIAATMVLGNQLRAYSLDFVDGYHFV